MTHNSMTAVEESLELLNLHMDEICMSGVPNNGKYNCKQSNVLHNGKSIVITGYLCHTFVCLYLLNPGCCSANTEELTSVFSTA